MSFEKLTIRKPFTLNPALADKFLICQNYLGRNHLYIEHLNFCLDQVTKLDHTEDDIIEIIPVKCFTISPFINYFREQTQRLMKRECQALKKLLWLITTENTPDISDRISRAARSIETSQKIV